MEMKREWETEIPMKISQWYGKDEFYLYVTLNLRAGLRPSESAALTWGDISKEPIDIRGEKYGTLKISKAIVKNENGIKDTQPKFDSACRDVYVKWQLIDEIYSHKGRGNENERILHTSPYYSKYNRRWARIKKDLPLPSELKWSNLRQYFIYYLVRSGFTKDDVLQQIGSGNLVPFPDLYFEKLR